MYGFYRLLHSWRLVIRKVELFVSKAPPKWWEGKRYVEHSQDIFCLEAMKMGNGSNRCEYSRVQTKLGSQRSPAQRVRKPDMGWHGLFCVGFTNTNWLPTTKLGHTNWLPICLSTIRCTTICWSRWLTAHRTVVPSTSAHGPRVGGCCAQPELPGGYGAIQNSDDFRSKRKAGIATITPGMDKWQLNGDCFTTKIWWCVIINHHWPLLLLVIRIINHHKSTILIHDSAITRKPTHSPAPWVYHLHPAP